MNNSISGFIEESLAQQLPAAPLPPRAVYSALKEAPIYRSILDLFLSGSIDEAGFKNIVFHLTRGFNQGERFRNDEALALLAVVVEGLSYPFTTDFLKDLSTIDVVELPLSPKIARLSMEVHSSRSKAQIIESGTPTAAPVDFRISQFQDGGASAHDATYDLEVEAC